MFSANCGRPPLFAFGVPFRSGTQSCIRCSNVQIAVRFSLTLEWRSSVTGKMGRQRPSGQSFHARSVLGQRCPKSGIITTPVNHVKELGEMIAPGRVSRVSQYDVVADARCAPWGAHACRALGGRKGLAITCSICIPMS
jgi:hypothetical protein